MRRVSLLQGLARRGLILAPCYREPSNEEERKATWLELFYDLIFVVAIGQIALKLSENYDRVGLLEFALLFITIWWAWVGHTMYLARFDSNDLIHRATTMAMMLGVAGLAASAPTAFGEAGASFAISYGVVRGMLVLEYWRAARYNPRQRALASGFARGFAIAAALWLASAALPTPYRELLWFGALLIDYITPFAVGQEAVRHPPHFRHLPERLGLFTILVIGESVLSIVMGVQKRGGDLLAYCGALLAMLIAFSIWWGYFETMQAAEERHVGDRKSQVVRYRLWLYLHLPFAAAIVTTAVGAKHAIGFGLKPMPGYEGWILAASVALCMIMLWLLGSTSQSYRGVRKSFSFEWPHHLLTLATVAMGALAAFIPSAAFLGLLALAFVAQLALSLRPRPEVA